MTSLSDKVERMTHDEQKPEASSEIHSAFKKHFCLQYSVYPIGVYNRDWNYISGDDDKFKGFRAGVQWRDATATTREAELLAVIRAMDGVLEKARTWSIGSRCEIIDEARRLAEQVV